MCGICGKLAFDREAQVSPGLIASMMGLLSHRGPDGQGSYVRGPVGLGHNRLSIIDLVTGEQPIANEDDSVTVVYNGEIYNFRELRQELAARGHRFKTSTDTEVIVHAYEEYGEQCVARLRGMFAFALWDERRQRLLLARDRVGIKPLYYAVTSEGLLFASELKALLLDPGVTRRVNLQGLNTFLSFLYMPGRETLLEGVFKLEPGHYLVAENGTVRTTRYWDREIAQPQDAPSLAASLAQLKELLLQTVTDHMISDVPVGVLLSGGVDSAGVLSMAAQGSREPLHAFTIGFDRPGFFDEREHAREVARRFGARHYETTISAEQFREFLPQYVWHMEEPVCEPPAVALYYVSRLAHEHVKVLLSGEGGDEAFAGYSNYRNMLWVERFKRALPRVGASGAAAVLRGLGRFTQPERARRYAAMLAAPLAEYYFSRTAGPESPFHSGKDGLYTAEFRSRIAGDQPAAWMQALFANVSGSDPLSQMLYVDTKTWLPDDLLVKADKMTMANSVELRVPLLDHRVLEFAAALPPEFKVRGRATKFILKEALRERVPAHILDKKKTGFPVPYAAWLGRELKDYVREVLTDGRTTTRGYFRGEAVEDILAGRSGGASEVFSLLVLELWHRQFIDVQPDAAPDLSAPGLSRAGAGGARA